MVAACWDADIAKGLVPKNLNKTGVKVKENLLMIATTH